MAGPEEPDGASALRFGPASGVVDFKIPWKYLALCIQLGTVEAMGTLGRTTAQIEYYRDFRKKALIEWRSMPDLMQWKVYDFPFETQPEGKKRVLLPTCEERRAQEAHWRDNDFPYNVEDGIRHVNVWRRQPMDDEELARAIEERYPGQATLHFVNPPELQSIPGMWHAHIFVQDPTYSVEEVYRQQGVQEHC